MKLGWPHPDYLLASMTTGQFDEWIAYYSLEPWGEERADLRSAMIAAVISSAHGVPASPTDFMPDYDSRFTPEENPSDEELKAKILAAFGIKAGE